MCQRLACVLTASGIRGRRSLAGCLSREMVSCFGAGHDCCCHVAAWPSPRACNSFPPSPRCEWRKDIAIQMCDVLDGGEYVEMLNAPNIAAARKSKLTPYVSLGERMGALQAQLLGRGKVCLPVLLLLLLLLLSPIFRKECRLTIVLIQRTVRSTPLSTPRWVRRSAAKGPKLAYVNTATKVNPKPSTSSVTDLVFYVCGRTCLSGSPEELGRESKRLRGPRDCEMWRPTPLPLDAVSRSIDRLFTRPTRFGCCWLV